MGVKSHFKMNENLMFYNYGKDFIHYGSYPLISSAVIPISHGVISKNVILLLDGEGAASFTHFFGEVSK